MRLHLDPTISIKDDIILIENAILVPPTPQDPKRWNLIGGIFTQDGQLVDAAICWQNSKRASTIPPAFPTDPIVKVSGTHLFGGVLYAHFGHFLCESTSRLWALDHISEKLDSVLFFPKKQDIRKETEHLAQEFLDLISCTAPAKALAGPVQVEKFHVPKQAFGTGDLLHGAPEFRDFMRDNLGKTAPDTGFEKLYISRRNLYRFRGCLVGEGILEDRLAAEGYHIFHPQAHSFAEQVSYYKSAKYIIGLDGSSLHLVAMLATAGQKVAVLQRRPSGDARMVVDHMNQFCPEEVLLINGTPTCWAPAGIRRAKHSVFGMMDFSVLGKSLTEAGFIAPATPWEAITEHQQQTLVQEIGERLDSDMVETGDINMRLGDIPKRSNPDQVVLIPASGT